MTLRIPFLNRLAGLAILLASFLQADWLNAQVVNVSATLVTNRIPVGGATLLQVYAEIVPGMKSSTDRIFSWHVDLLNSDGAIAALDYAQFQRSASDQDPRYSSTGITEGGDRTGIHDTFIGQPDAGRLAPVLLFSVPVKGSSAGTTRLRVRAGTAESGFAHDFIVAPAGGGDPLTGAVYDQALAVLEVFGGSTVTCPIQLRIEHKADGIDRGTTLLFTPCPDFDHHVEFAEQLSGLWRALPGAPHNTGRVVDSAADAPQRFYRVKQSPKL